MRNSKRPARLNLKVLIVLVSISVALAAGAVFGHYVRKRMFSDEALASGRAALDREAWADAVRHLRHYLSKYPDDLEMLGRYAEANMAVRPIEPVNIGSAIDAYRRLLRHQPGDAKICKQLARLYFAYGNYVEAAYVCRERLKVDQADASAMMWLARALAAQQKREEAQQVLLRLIERHPERVPAYALLGSLALKQDSTSGLETAAGWLSRAVEANPKSAEAVARRARFRRVVSRDPTAAREDLDAAEALQTDDPRVHLLLAEEWLEWGEYDLATESVARSDDVEEAVLERYEVDPEVISFARFTALANLALRDPRGADHAALADTSLETLFGARRIRFLPLAVRLYLAGGQLDKAQQSVAAYGAAIKARTSGAEQDPEFIALQARVAQAKEGPYAAMNILVPEGSETRLNRDGLELLADVFHETGQLGRSREVLLKLVEQSPLDWGSWLKLSDSFRGEDWDRSYFYANTAWRLRPTLGARLSLLEARLMRAAGRPEEAQATREVADALEDLQKQFPTAAGIRVLLAIIASEQGRSDVATSVLEGAIAECDQTMSAELLLADFHFRAGRSTEARTLYEAIIEKAPERSAPRIHLAELNVASDQEDEARLTYRQAIQDLSGDERLKTVRAYVRFLLKRDQQSVAVDLLRELVTQHTADVDLHSALLAMPEVWNDVEEAQRLIDEIRAIEGDGGVRWKLGQATLWLSTAQWRVRERETAELLEACALADPAWEEPVLALGSLHQALGRLREAESVYRLTLAHKRSAFGVADRLVGLLKTESRYVEAQEVLDSMPQTSAALSAHRIDLAIGRGEYDNAMEALELHVATHPDDVPSHIRLARLTYVVKKDADGAMKLLEVAGLLAPDSIDVLFAKVSVMQAEGQRDEAIALLNAEVVRLDNFAIYWLRATYYAAIGEDDLAQKDYLYLTTLEDSVPAGHGLLGNFYYKRGRTADAIAVWEQGLERDPDNVTLRRALTKGLLASDDPELHKRGRAILAELQDRMSDDPELLRVEAALLFEERTSEARAQAVDRLERAVALNPTYVSSHLMLIDLAKKDGDLQRARRHVSRALASNPTHVGLKIQQITVELGLRNTAVARELARGLIEERSGDLSIANQLSDAFRRAGRIEDGIAFNEEALSISPKDEFANITRAALLVVDGKGDAAREHLAAFVGTDTGRSSVPALLALASQHTAHADFASADSVLQLASELAPGGVGVTVERLRWLGAQQRFDEVHSLIAEDAWASKESLSALMTGANLLALAGSESFLREARNAFERILELDPNNVPARFGFAQVAQQLNDVPAAIDALRTAVEIEPGNAVAVNNLAWMLSSQGKRDPLEEAAKLAERGVAQHPLDSHLRDTYGVVLQKLGRLEEARTHLEQCVALPDMELSTRAKVLLHLAQVLVELRADEALIRTRLDEAGKIDQIAPVFSDEERADLTRLLKSL